jgi:hypothetical protein
MSTAQTKNPPNRVPKRNKVIRRENGMMLIETQVFNSESVVN